MERQWVACNCTAAGMQVWSTDIDFRVARARVCVCASDKQTMQAVDHLLTEEPRDRTGCILRDEPNIVENIVIPLAFSAAFAKCQTTSDLRRRRNTPVAN